jgi:hypothetical protein
MHCSIVAHVSICLPRSGLFLKTVTQESHSVSVHQISKSLLLSVSCLIWHLNMSQFMFLDVENVCSDLYREVLHSRSTTVSRPSGLSTANDPWQGVRRVIRSHDALLARRAYSRRNEVDLL